MFDANTIKPNNERDVLAKLSTGQFAVVRFSQNPEPDWRVSDGVDSYDGYSGVILSADVVAWCELPR